MPGLPSQAAAVRLRSSNAFREGWTQRRDVPGFTACTSSPRFAVVVSHVSSLRRLFPGAAGKGLSGSTCTPANKAGLCTNHSVSSRPAKCASNSNEERRQPRLSMLDSSERQVDAWLSDSRLFGNFVFEVSLRLPGHDEQTSGWQPFREHNCAILRFQTKQPFRA